MKVEWREGEWKEDRPVEPEDCGDCVWVIRDYKYARPHCTDTHGVSFYMRMVLAAQRKNEEEAGDKKSVPPRWWWCPLEEPDNLPAGHPRKNW